jgi:hypothetical protein
MYAVRRMSVLPGSASILVRFDNNIEARGSLGR